MNTNLNRSLQKIRCRFCDPDGTCCPSEAPSNSIKQTETLISNGESLRKIKNRPERQQLSRINQTNQFGNHKTKNLGLDSKKGRIINLLNNKERGRREGVKDGATSWRLADRSVNRHTTRFEAAARKRGTCVCDSLSLFYFCTSQIRSTRPDSTPPPPSLLSLSLHAISVS